MKIKLKANMADPVLGAHQAGARLTVDEKEGRALVAGGYAEEIKPAAPAVPPAPAKKDAKEPKVGLKGAPAGAEAKA